jgi:hypothetical protein
MSPEHVRALLERVRGGELPVDDAMAELAELPFHDLVHTKVDHHRSLRTGLPEVVYGAGKTAAQIIEIMQDLHASDGVALATRVDPEAASDVVAALPEAHHDPLARTIAWGARPSRPFTFVIVCAGTSDRFVAQEAEVTARTFGYGVERIDDVGVAGLHRIAAHRPLLERADVLLVIAGMEGALASVVAGLTTRPIVAVPTSVGYGASFGGLAALLGMLSGCAPGVAVVNIDNGFGAACLAARIVSSRSE